MKLQPRIAAAQLEVERRLSATPSEREIEQAVLEACARQELPVGTWQHFRKWARRQWLGERGLAHDHDARAAVL